MKDSPADPPKEKQSRIASIVGFVLLHVFLHGSVVLSVFALVTLNTPLIIAITVLILLQSRLTKIKPIANYLAKNMHPAKAFNSFNIIDDYDAKDKIPDSKQKVIFGFHPHGIYALGFLSSFNQQNDPDLRSITGLASNFILNLPILGAILRVWGIQPASNQRVKSLMKRGKNLALLPGGFQEATLTSPNELRLWIKERKGFIKYALEYNYAIRPVLITQEHQGFWTLQTFEKARLWLNKFKLPGVVFWNKFWGLILPISLDVTILKGRAINVQTQHHEGKEHHQPSKERVDKVHQEYMEEIERLYAKYQSLNGGKPLKLY